MTELYTKTCSLEIGYMISVPVEEEPEPYIYEDDLTEADRRANEERRYFDQWDEAHG